MNTSLIAFCVALAGPFSTYSAFPLQDRAIYWGIVIFAALPTSMTLRHILFRFGYRESSLGYAIWMVPSMGLIYGSFVWLVTQNYPGINPALIPRYAVMVGVVALVAMIVVLARNIYYDTAADNLAMAARQRQTDAPLPARDDPEQGGDAAKVTAVGLTDELPPRLQRRLPADMTGQILRLEARDHFVRVVTLNARHEIRLRFADAVNEMDCVPGVSTHRSHWVRLSAVMGAERDGPRLFLLMADGARVPVSRGYRDRVEAAGLITRDMLVAASATEQIAAQ